MKQLTHYDEHGPPCGIWTLTVMIVVIRSITGDVLFWDLLYNTKVVVIWFPLIDPPGLGPTTYTE